VAFRDSKPAEPVAIEGAAEIARNVLIWLNTYPDLPAIMNYEYLPAAAPKVALSTIQGAYITKRYILGGYEAEYQFKVIYRISPGNSMDERLQADEMLNRLGAWAQQNLPNLGEKIRTIKVEATTLSALFAQYEGGLEDHQILMKLTYEVM